MRNHYLDLLELDLGANEQDIKKAYRRLSKKYHPDLNKPTSSRDKFIEITEAYDFLLEVGPRPHNEPISYDYNVFVDEFEERRKWARKKAEERAKEKEANAKRVDHFLKVANWIFMTLVVLFFLDIILPKRHNEVKVWDNDTHWIYEGKVNGEEVWVPSRDNFRLYHSGGIIILSTKYADQISRGDQGIIGKTLFYGLSMSFQHKKTGRIFLTTSPLFTQFLFFPLCIFVCSFVALVATKRSVKWNFGGTGFVMLPLYLLILWYYH